MCETFLYLNILYIFFIFIYYYIIFSYIIYVWKSKLRVQELECIIKSLPDISIIFWSLFFNNPQWASRIWNHKNNIIHIKIQGNETLGIKITKKVQCLYEENLKFQMKTIKRTAWRTISCSQGEDLIFLAYQFVYNLLQRINTTQWKLDIFALGILTSNLEESKTLNETLKDMNKIFMTIQQALVAHASNSITLETQLGGFP